jgi:type IV pilus assembly protein PilQ
MIVSKNMTLQHAVRAAVAIGMALSAWSAQAQNAIEAVAASIQGGVEVVRVDLSQPLTVPPAGFTIQSPARIALDFPGVGSSLGRSQVEINQGNLKSANVVQAGDRTRLVLNLKQATSYRTEIQGKSLLIWMDPLASASTATPAVQPQTTFAENRNRESVPLKDIDFRRAPDGAGRLIVDLANNQVGVDIKQQGQNLVVEFLKSSLPEGLRRRLDVGDFGTPIQMVSTFQAGDRVPKANGYTAPTKAITSLYWKCASKK